VAGAAMTAAAVVRIHQTHTFVEAVGATPFSIACGTIAGSLCAFLVWALWRPRARLTRGGIALAGVNCAAWLCFLVLNPRLTGEDASILQQRAHIDAKDWPSGMIFTDHPTTLLAGRPLNWVNYSQKPLGLFAGPAVVFVHEQTVPARYWRTGATVSESNWIAAVGFIISTAWWVSVGSIVSNLRSMKRNRAAHGAITKTIV
jgi:hypothetical protein